MMRKKGRREGGNRVSREMKEKGERKNARQAARQKER
jgi:hypothetical protein